MALGWRSPRARRLAFWIVLAIFLYVRCAPRPSFLPLATRISGPEPAKASAVVVLLHGRGGGLRSAERMAGQLRDAGLPTDASIVLVEAPYSTWFGHQWGDRRETQATSRARIRARLDELLGAAPLPRGRVVVAGFSQGAGMAIDLAVDESRIGRLASFSPCSSWLRGELPKHDVRVFLAHGRGDAICPVEESRSLAKVLDAAKRPATYVEFDGGHHIPMDVAKRFVAFVMEP